MSHLPALPALERRLGREEISRYELSVPNLERRVVRDEDPEKLGVEPHGLKRGSGHSTERLEIARVEMLLMLLEDRKEGRLPGDQPASLLCPRNGGSSSDPEPRLFEELSGSRREKRGKFPVGQTLDTYFAVVVVDRAPGKRVKPSEEAKLSAPLDEQDFGRPTPARHREAHRGTNHGSIIEWADGNP